MCLSQVVEHTTAELFRSHKYENMDLNKAVLLFVWSVSFVVT